MPLDSSQPPPDRDVANRLAQLERRVARLEARLPAPAPVARTSDTVPALTPAFETTGRIGEDELEFEIGQNWFALAGIFVLTVGVAFLLLLPFSSLPAITPPLIGFAAAAGLFGLARAWRRAFELVASYLFGGGMALFFLGALRLCFPAQHHVLDLDHFAGRGALVAAVAVNIALSLRRASPWLFFLALLTGAIAGVAVGTGWFVLAVVLAIAVVAVGAARRHRWPTLLSSSPLLAYGTYFAWAISGSFHGDGLHFQNEPMAAPGAVLAMLVLFAAGVLLRPLPRREDAASNTAALINTVFGYLVFLVHTGAAYPGSFIALQLAASLVLLALAVAFWLSERSRISTFFYAMAGYAALSMAILRASTMPDVFVWLSLQSLLVVTTAIWFRSRFIVVANFAIYVAIVFAYVIFAERETGISIGFGIVALLSARILNWQKSRLELHTELMRNAYLVSAFLIFPYALYHLVPAAYVALAWIALATIYYTLNLIVNNRKYRWMGHATLLLTTLYLIVGGAGRFEASYRIVSFLALGTVLLVVSLSFTRSRRRRAQGPADRSGPPSPPRRDDVSTGG